MFDVQVIGMAVASRSPFLMSSLFTCLVLFTKARQPCSIAVWSNIVALTHVRVYTQGFCMLCSTFKRLQWFAVILLCAVSWCLLICYCHQCIV